MKKWEEVQYCEKCGRYLELVYGPERFSVKTGEYVDPDVYKCCPSLYGNHGSQEIGHSCWTRLAQGQAWPGFSPFLNP